MSKVDMPRPRYIAFRLHGPTLTRRALAQGLRTTAQQASWKEEDGPHLTRYEWPFAIVRVEHDRDAAARRLLDGLQVGPGVRAETLATSGTLKALTTKIGALAERGDKATESTETAAPGATKKRR